MRISFDRLLLFLLFGLVLYLTFCNKPDSVTKQEGKRLEALSDSALKKLDLVFEHLKQMDSIEVINNYYTSKYYYEKQSKDSLLAVHPELADSLFLFYVRKLSAEPSPFK